MLYVAEVPACTVKLHNAVAVSQQRLGKRVAELSFARMTSLWAAISE